MTLDIELEREKLKRRRAVSEAMLAGSMQPGPVNTQFVDPYSPLAKVAQAYFGGQERDRVDTEERALGEKQRQDVAEALADFQRSTTPRQASYEHIVDEQANGGEGRSDTITTPAYNPSTQDRRTAAMNLLTKVGDPKDAAKLTVAQAMAGGSGSFGKIDPKDYTPESVRAFNESGDFSQLVPRPRYHTVGSNLVAEPTAPNAPVTPTYTAPKEPPEAIRTLEAAGLVKGTPAWDAAMKDLIAKTTKHAPAPTAIATASTEKGYGQHFAGEVAKQDVGLLEAARKAPELATRANQVKEVLASGKVITGAAADYRLALGKAMGLVGASDAETIANTETLSVNLARNTLDAIKASGLGSGSGFSNADRDFLEKAAGGKINLEATTIGRLADLSHRAAELSAGRWNQRVKDIPDSALSGTGIKRDPVTVPALFGAKAKGPAISPEVAKFLRDNNIPVPGEQ